MKYRRATSCIFEFVNYIAERCKYNDRNVICPSKANDNKSKFHIGQAAVSNDVLKAVSEDPFLKWSTHIYIEYQNIVIVVQSIVRSSGCSSNLQNTSDYPPGKHSNSSNSPDASTDSTGCHRA